MGEGAETGAVKKDWAGRIRVALVYPNAYALGMANLGFQAVYRIANDLDHVVCERAFADPHMTIQSVPRLMESGRPVTGADIIAFSLPFENDVLHLLRFLRCARLPLRSVDRVPPHPLVAAGGVATFLNPEPLAPFLDLLFIGEAEETFPAFLNAYDPAADRPAHLHTLARNVQGLYVPAAYRAKYNTAGTIRRFHPVADVPERVVRAVSDQTAQSAFVTGGAVFESAHLVEIGRGCPHGCRFCAAGFIYRPPRFLPPAILKDRINRAFQTVDRVGLLGAAVTDVSGITEVIRCAAASDRRLSISSVRADRVTPELAEALFEAGLKTATVAPDAGSHRLRNVINKNLTQADILAAVTRLTKAGIPNLRLYFMIGLPTETEEDISAIIDLVKEVKGVFLENSRPLGRMGTIAVSVSPFVPKPWTPFQWTAMQKPALLKKKLKMIKAGLQKIPNMRVRTESPAGARFQALVSRGDRRTGALLEYADQKSRSFRELLKDSAAETDFYVHRERAPGEIHPWDFIDTGIRKDFLFREYRRALQAKPTPPCNPETCRLCGVCGKPAELRFQNKPPLPEKE
jgi:radical SAM superfamily enzyme YgiQ (UPF0313 family)